MRRTDFDRRGTQQQPNPTLVTGNKAVQKSLVQGRQSGHLKLRGKGLTALPPEACNIGSVPLPESNGVFGEGGAWWETRETLETLDCSENEITALPNEITGLDQLRELNALHNKLTALPEYECWEPLESLVNLCVGHNQLAALPEGFGHANRPPLVRLAAHNNRLTQLPQTLGGLCDLVELDLSHNQLRQLPPGLSSLGALKKLRLSSNALSSLPDDFLQHPPPLVDADMSENHLHSLAFPVPTVQTLNLAKNRLVALELDGCYQLQELTAPYNQLTSLPNGLPRLPSLATIDVGSNKLIKLEELTHCKSLTRIDVSNNDVKEVPPLLGNLALNKLALLGNPLRTMPSAILNGPTPKLLAHLRGKIVDAAPQWEGDQRGTMAVGPPAEFDRSMASIGSSQDNIIGRGGGGGGGFGVACESGPIVFGGQAQQTQQQQFGGYEQQRQMQQQQFMMRRQQQMGGGANAQPPPQQHPPPQPQQQHSNRSGYDALYNRPPPPPPQPPQPQHQYGTAAASAPFQTMANSQMPEEAAAIHAGLGELAACVQKDGTELMIASMRLTSLPMQGYPESLTRIDASNNMLTSVPDTLCDLCPELMALDVSRNKLSGSLPAELSLCPDLASVRIERNLFTSLDFCVHSPLPCLIELNADRNQITQVPEALWACPKLKHVSLCGNKLTSASLRMPPSGSVGGAPLEHLDLSENRLGAFPPLSNYPLLREVHVQQAGIRELPVNEVRNLRQLQTLDVSMNDVPSLPPELALLPVLQNLTIIGNPIRSIPQSVQQRGATAVLDLLKKRLGQ